jgi:hypothetical protein
MAGERADTIGLPPPPPFDLQLQVMVMVIIGRAVSRWYLIATPGNGALTLINDMEMSATLSVHIVMNPSVSRQRRGVLHASSGNGGRILHV